MTVLGTGHTMEVQVTLSDPHFAWNCVQDIKVVPNKFLIWS